MKNHNLSFFLPVSVFMEEAEEEGGQTREEGVRTGAAELSLSLDWMASLITMEEAVKYSASVRYEMHEGFYTYTRVAITWILKRGLQTKAWH